MDRLNRQAITRRHFLKAAGGGLAAAGLAPLIAACGGGSEASEATTSGTTQAATAGGATTQAATTEAAATPAGDLKFWWWGEQEAVGIQAWVDETLAAFEQEQGASVETNLLDTAQVIPQFTNAAAAGQPPDVQFFWNGIYHMENAWLGYIEPLNDLLPAETLEASGATPLSVFQGNQYRVGWYALGLGIAYNKALFESAGLDPETPPATWDEFLDACDKLKASGVIPIGGGVKDGFLGEWYFDQSLTQNLDSPADAINLFIGDLDWRDPRYHEHWVKLQELKDNEFFNDDILSLDLYPGIQLLDTGKAAMTINVSPGLTNSQKALGDDVLGYMIMPVFGIGEMAGIPIVDTQGFGIAAEAANKEGAARLLEYLQTPDRVNAIYAASGQIPASDNFDPSVIDNPLTSFIYENWMAVPNNVYIPDLMPSLFWTDAMFVAAQKVLGGEMTGEQTGELAAEVTEKWKRQNPDLVEKYTQWKADLGL